MAMDDVARAAELAAAEAPAVKPVDVPQDSMEVNLSDPKKTMSNGGSTSSAGVKRKRPEDDDNKGDQHVPADGADKATPLPPVAQQPVIKASVKSDQPMVAASDGSVQQEEEVPSSKADTQTDVTSEGQSEGNADAMIDQPVEPTVAKDKTDDVKSHQPMVAAGEGNAEEAPSSDRGLISVNELVRLAKEKARAPTSGESTANKHSKPESSNAAEHEITNGGTVAVTDASDDDATVTPGDGHEMQDGETKMTLPAITPPVALARPEEYASKIKEADVRDRAEARKRKKKKRKQSKSSSGGDGSAEEEDGSNPAKKKKTKKDPNAPTKALSAYLFYAREERAKVRAEKPDIPFGELGKIVGKRWREIGAEEKKRFEALAAEDTARHDREMSEYKDKKKMEEEVLAQMQPKKKKETSTDLKDSKSEEGSDSWRPGSDEDSGSAPLSGGYMLYAREKMSSVLNENPDLSYAELGKIMAKQWRSMNVEEKKRFEDMAVEANKPKLLPTTPKTPTARLLDNKSVDGGVLANIGKPSDTKRPKTPAKLIKSGPAGNEIGEGWTVKTFQRQTGTSAGHEDNYWYSPALEKKFRSLKEIKRFQDALKRIKEEKGEIDDKEAEKLAWRTFKVKKVDPATPA